MGTCFAPLIIALALAGQDGRIPDPPSSLLWPSRPDNVYDDGVAPPQLVFSEQSLEATLYTRFDYFAWNEQYGGDRLLDEYGTLYTLGYQRRLGFNRFRLEVFDGVVHYEGATQSGRPVSSTTGYMGARGEGERIWDLDVQPKATTSFFAGLGSRIWLRDLRDGTIIGADDYSSGYQETWWTIYPYCGLEKKWLLENNEEIFLSGRLGCTAMTYQMASLDDAAPLFPRVNISSQVECGLRYGHFSMSACFESMTWQHSAEARGWIQPDSRMTTVGLKLALNY
ncbi:MAG: hypothetical protein ABFC63_10210 [Thermoguttaceae bacterium]